MISLFAVIFAAIFLLTGVTYALERPDMEFKVFQFPRNMMPRIDADASDWDIVPDDYSIGTDQLLDTTYGMKTDPKDKDITVKVGWVKGLSRLYFLVEAYDDYWDFEAPDLHNDILELVVDGDLSGGGFLPRYHHADSLISRVEQHSRFHGIHELPKTKSSDCHGASSNTTAPMIPSDSKRSGISPISQACWGTHRTSVHSG